MDKTMINKYTEQIKKEYLHLVNKKPDSGTGLHFYLDAFQRDGSEWDKIINQWLTNFREIYNYISDEVKQGRTSFESNTFIQEATILIDKYNQVHVEVSAIRDHKQKGNKADEYEFFAWNYTITFCDYIKDTFTRLIENCRKAVSAPDPKATPKPTPTPNFDELKRYFKSGFCGSTPKSEDKFTNNLIPLLKQPKNGKEAAALSLVLFESKQLNDEAPITFLKWHKIFCELTNYPFVEYNPQKIRKNERHNRPSYYTKFTNACYFL